MDPAAYYAETSSNYDRIHLDEHEHDIALAYISALTNGFGWTSLLDVGTGTGRAVQHLTTATDAVVKGIEPVPELIAEAERKPNIQPGQIQQGTGQQLPYGPDSFDVVLETSVLHHVPDPNQVVSEMTRVARRAVFLSDVNRFGTRGGTVKLALWMLRLWGLVDRAKTRGRGYRISQGDGVSWSYSVYDSYSVLADWGRVFFIPLVTPRSRTWAHPLLSADHILACAVRDI
jgi:SAM-dependent methyltransferase